VWSLAAVLLATAANAQAASNVVEYGPAPAWVTPPPAPTDTAAPDGAPIRVVYLDNQVRLGPDGDEIYTAYRMKILQPQALALGNVSAAWSPSTDDMRVHALKIIRDGKVIDVLAGQKFKVIQRENNLERSALDGALTATLQTPGLQVGDEIEFAATIKRRDPTLGDRSQGALLVPPVGAPGAYRMRLVWPKSKIVRWRATPDLGELKPADGGGDLDLRVELRDLKSVIVADGAPARVNLRRFLQYSGFSDWAEVSTVLQPLYEKASTLGPDSPVKAEAARIAAATSDPKARAAAALKLVQDRIRYVYIGLGDGNYRPAAADETWTRRFGDCKAKTVLLLALLRELGIPAEAVLVNSQGGDGIDERLPMLAAFDHVLVRATVAGRAYWLDGTRLGDANLDLVPTPVSRWALPIRAAKAELERVEPDAPTLARSGLVLDIDATKGFDAPARVSAEQIFRGDDALAFKVALAKLSTEDSDRQLKAWWRDQVDWLEPETAAWRYDETQNLLVMTVTGEGKPEWEGDDKEGRSLDVYGAGFTPPSQYRRPKEQDQTAPWTTGSLSFKRWTTIIRLPPETDGWKWAYRAAQVDEQMGGVAYWRDAELRNGVLRTTMSIRHFNPEITAEEAQAVNKRLPNFNNKISQVWQYRPEPGSQPAETVSLSKVIAGAGNDVGRLVSLGDALLQGEDYDQALRLYDKALAVDRASAAAVRGKADALALRGDPKGALRFLDRAAKPGADPLTDMVRARALVAAGQAKEGFALLDAIEAAHRDDVPMLMALMRAESRVGRADRALAIADAAVKLAPADVHLRRFRAGLETDPGHGDAALADLDEALRLEPESVVNLLNRARAFSRLGRVDQALADVEEALRIDPFDSFTLDTKADIFLRAGRKAEAYAVLDLAVERDRSAVTLNSRCWARALGNADLVKAEADCAEATKLAPKDAAFWDSYALVALRAGRLDDALRRYDQALALSPKQAASLYGRGLTRLRKGEEADGRADIAAAKAIAPQVDEELTAAGVTPPV
jgi:tetratricopeptide (TPR) repeat protein/transglutaminase-like putative cysteine protease